MIRNLAAAIAIVAMAVMAATAAPPAGNETINYTYDARGRLTNVIHTGSVNNNVATNYTYDKADNRVTVNVTGAPN